MITRTNMVVLALSLGTLAACDNAVLLADGQGTADGGGTSADAHVTHGNDATTDSASASGDGNAGDAAGTSGGDDASDAAQDEAALSDGALQEAATDAGLGDDAVAPEAGTILGAGGPPSCLGLAENCGPAHNESCCASSLVPGGTFVRNNGVMGNYPAQVGDFQLDRFEVTVGRFRTFWQQYPGNMPAGSSGIDTNNPSDEGWDPAWNGASYLPQSASVLDTDIAQCPTSGAWIDWSLSDATLPINCITWYEAYAFCIWDGGRLPTDVEWNYAAAGGSDQRPYPWSTSPSDTTIDSTYAVIAPYAAVYAPVGSDSPKGDGKWGHADLAGNVMEWVEDWRQAYPATCDNCANVDWNFGNTIPPGGGPYRQVRGGSAGDDSSFQLSSNPWYYNVPTFRIDNIGVRCARNP
jgi:formylglycine-generating enzyme required for sulfatase activity